VWCGLEPGTVRLPAGPETELEEAMAVPKRKTSKRRKRLRRSHHSAAGIALQACPRCGSQKLPHRVCDSCGYYAGKKRIEIAD
jgi:large subunit ribosomal protein L32